MCDPKSHRRCINKGILWRNNKNSGVILPDSGIRAIPAITPACMIFCLGYLLDIPPFFPLPYLFQAACPSLVCLYVRFFSIPVAHSELACDSPTCQSPAYVEEFCVIITQRWSCACWEPFPEVEIVVLWITFLHIEFLCCDFVYHLVETPPLNNSFLFAWGEAVEIHSIALYSCKFPPNTPWMQKEITEKKNVMQIGCWGILHLGFWIVSGLCLTWEGCEPTLC